MQASTFWQYIAETHLRYGLAKSVAKLSDLIPTLANVTGMPKTAVGAYARTLRQAGHITSGGRGPGGAEMTPKDCANLLIAVMAGSPTHAVERLRIYGALTSSKEPGDRGDPLETMLDLRLGHSLLDMLTVLISKAQYKPIDRFMERAFITANLMPKNFNWERFARISVEIASPYTYALVTATAYKSTIPGDTAQLGIYYQPRRIWRRKGQSLLFDTSKGDLSQNITVGSRTIDALGQLLGAGGG